MTLSDMLANLDNLATPELLALNRAAAQAWNSRSEEMRRGFRVGNHVMFFDNQGNRHFGHVAKVMRKNVRVDVNGTMWKISPGALSFA